MAEPSAGQGFTEPTQIGPYRILEMLGEGGMGTVYLGEQRAPIHRRVALKVIKLGMDTKAVLARFEAERQVLAMMEHSCIARIFDAGVSQDGRPYFAMEYIKGIPITDYCDQNQLPLHDRIRLFQKVCAAVQHAHQRGIIHRDLKPSNILVTVQDGTAEPRIIDFGLAKALNQRVVEATIFTEQGQIIGTPEYMSPEQAGLGGLGVDSRTDVYSLGILLYELLTGTLPFSRRELREAAYHELQRIIRETEPAKPSTKLTTLGGCGVAVAHARRLAPKTLRRALTGHLDRIVLKALAKNCTQRYTTPLELAEDLDRHLRGLAPVARGPSLVRRSLRLVHRRPVVALALLSLAGGTAYGGVWMARTLRSPIYRLVVSVSPPDASVYVNGGRVGSGAKRPVLFDFGAYGRQFVQVVHPDCEPFDAVLSEEETAALADAQLDFRITLRAR